MYVLVHSIIYLLAAKPRGGVFVNYLFIYFYSFIGWIFNNNFFIIIYLSAANARGGAFFFK